MADLRMYNYTFGDGEIPLPSCIYLNYGGINTSPDMKVCHNTQKKIGFHYFVSLVFKRF